MDKSDNLDPMDALSDSPPHPQHPIGVVCRRTGLKPDLIRAWERRYGAIQPRRSPTRRRLYSDSDIERLKLLREAVSGGRGIRHVASLAKSELLDLIAADKADRPSAPSSRSSSQAVIGLKVDAAEGLPHKILHNCLAAISKLDGSELEHELERASVALSRVDVMEHVIVPLMGQVGELWKQGSLRPLHEHLASVTVRSFLGRLPTRQTSVGAPRVLVTTPAGQHHELGALLVAECASEEGWSVTYLGTDLPAEEIAAGCVEKSVRAVALSITYPPDDPQVAPELRRLRRLLAPDTTILVGGRSAGAYQPVVREISARYLRTLSDLRTELEALRNGL